MRNSGTAIATLTLLLHDCGNQYLLRPFVSARPERTRVNPGEVGPMKRTLLFMLAFALCFAGTSLYASTIFTENFDSATPGLTVTTAGQFHTIAGTNVDVIPVNGNFSELVVAPESGLVVDLGGTDPLAIGQLQSGAIALGPGSYFLSFALVGSQRGTDTITNVMLGPSGGPALYDQTFTLASSDNTSGIVTNQLFTVSSSETVFLTFSLLGTDNPNIGSLLDNVSITTAATPEPSSLLMLAVGLTGFGGLIRRKVRS
jgi:PEP-CTERM motif